MFNLVFIYDVIYIYYRKENYGSYCLWCTDVIFKLLLNKVFSIQITTKLWLLAYKYVNSKISECLFSLNAHFAFIHL